MPEIQVGTIAELSSRVRRLTAPNGGPMTGPGTNTYLLGREQVAVIDPGPLDAGHTDAILRQVEAPVRWILATHTHPDHSPGVKALAAATGAEVLGRPAPTRGPQDQTFKPDRVLEHDALIECPEFSLRAVHTPGHASNHLCYVLEDERMIFTGDHIMNGSTVVIAPPDGDMTAYIQSLKLLKEYDLQSIAPGHGDTMDSPQEVVDWIVEHRYQREEKVLRSVRKLGDADLQELVAVVYDDVNRLLHGVAKLSLEAHLIKLLEDGQVIRSGQHWRPGGD